MHVVRLAEAPAYEAPKHFDVSSLRLQSAETSGAEFCAVGLSYYQPGGRAEMDAGPQPKIYVVLSGEISVTLASGEKTVLGPFDSCVIEANENRAVTNDTTGEVVMLVITPPAFRPPN